jgi:hypothetical protein
LQTIEVDLTYTDPSSYHDIKPHYDELLPNGQPTWPSYLRVVEFENLRNLDAAEADGFFQSLVDSAHELKDLRRLSLKAILKIGWRDRAQLREKWKANLENVFLRRSLPPRSFTPASMKPSPIESSWETNAVALMGSRPENDQPPFLGQDSDSPERLSHTIIKKRKSTRIAQKELGSFSTPTFGEQSKTSSRERQSAVNGHRSFGGFIHGMVDEVVLRLDDQRPSEAQFNEADFLDSEQTDEDWDGT